MLENPVTAIIILGEGYAAQAIMELEKLGKRVPEDISLLAQGIPHFSEYLRPPLSSIQQDFSTLAGAAVKLMLRLIRREPGLADIWVPPLLLPGKSVLRLS